MRFCLCSSLNDDTRIPNLKKHGCNCFETNLTSLENTSDAEIEAYAKRLRELALPLIAYNCIFPSRYFLLGGQEVYAEIAEYLHRILTKLKLLGGEILVLGSGRSRNIPEGMTREEAKARFVALLRDCIAPTVMQYGMTVVVEELRCEETNFINSCVDALEIVREVDHPSIRMHIDYYHATLSGDTCEDFLKCGDYLRHVHIASPKRSRAYPNEEDFEDCKKFFAALKAIGYDGAISIEGDAASPFDRTLAVCMDVMTRAWNEA